MTTLASGQSVSFPLPSTREAATPHSRLRRGPGFRSVASAIVGVILGLGLCEAGLRLLATPSAGESSGTNTIIRQYEEGVSSATFAEDGRRLTGNAILPSAAVGVIVGDSHVEAIQVRDRYTMGSVLERLLRSAGAQTNIEQYGLSGQAAPAYCNIAPTVLSRWNPAWIVVLLNRDDFGNEAFSGSSRFVQKPDGSLSLAYDSPITYFGPTSLGDRTKQGIEGFIRRHSVLGTQAYRKWKLFTAPAAPYSDALDAKVLLTARRSVAELSKAYGPKLIIAYDPQKIVPQESSSDPVEKQFLQACQIEKTRCISLATALKPEVWNRGFSNTLPNVGHYNPTGHAAIAAELFKALQPENPISE